MSAGAGGRVPRGGAFAPAPLAALLLLLPLLMLGAACGREPGPRPHVALITVDTLRADHLESYGSTSTRTPNASRLAAEGTLFDNATAPVPLTRPSHSTLFTSRHPRLHGVTDNHLALPESELTVAEVFREAGYRTGGFVGAHVIGRPSGATQGLDHLETPEAGKRPSAARVVERAVAWLRTLPRDEPFFLWVHVFDPHLPYAPPEYYLPAPPPAGPALGEVTWRRLRRLARRGGGALDTGVLERARELYAAEVDSVDAALGLLLLELDERALADRTLVVLTADHGECFENGYYFRHDGCLYDGAVKVPLVFRYPGRVAAGARRAAQVRHEDVAPTLLTLAGLPVPERFEGRPLFRRDGAPEALDEHRVALVQRVCRPSGPRAPGRRSGTASRPWPGSRCARAPSSASPSGAAGGSTSPPAAGPRSSTTWPPTRGRPGTWRPRPTPGRWSCGSARSCAGASRSCP